MQKIVINNFLSVKNAEIVIPKMLVLIGEQASGKSTIAKLIYFFKSLNKELYNYLSQNKLPFEFETDILQQTKLSFSKLFSSTVNLQEFNIKYYYDIKSKKYLQISANETGEIVVLFSNNMFHKNNLKKINELKNWLITPFNDSTNDLSNKIHTIQIEITHEELSKLLNTIFKVSNNPLFIPTNRGFITTYSNLFTNTTHEREDANETLMFKFLQRVDYIKSFFYKNKDFKKTIETYIKDEKINISELYNIKRDIKQILNGEYKIHSEAEEWILNEKGHKINLSDLSTGQKEIIRVLQDILISVITDESVFRVIEAPESNLHPITQKQVTELLCFLANNNKNNEIIITTNSPYILSTLNNLLFAAKVIKFDGTTLNYIDKYIPIEYHLNSKEFAIYSLDNEITEQDYCVDIKSEIGLIGQNYLDTVSKMLNEDFQVLYKLYSKSLTK